MDIYRYDGKKESRKYVTAEDMLADAKKEAKNPETKKLVLHFPRCIIPSKRKKR